MTKYTTVLGNVLRHLSRSDFESAISGYEADRRVRYFRAYDLFKSLLYGLITGCFSVREIEKSMMANSNRLYGAGVKQVKRSTFCDTLERMRHDIFGSVFHFISGKARRIGGNIHKRFKDPLRIVDASIISVCLSRFNWAAYRKAKGAVKLHMNLDGDTRMPLDAYLSTGKVHDVQEMHRLCQESGVIYVMDRGYVDYKSLYCIELQGSVFVTRMKSNGAYRRIRNNRHEGDGPVVSDVVIALTGAKTKEKYPKELRKVKYYDKETKRVYEFITNDFERSAEDIAAIYKERWEVELFFKWIKQNLKIKSFWGTSVNGVFTQIWVALILSILLWICRTLDGIQATSHDLLVMLKTTLLTKNTLLGLCTNTAPPGQSADYSQLFLEGFSC
jgi:hypothetical protein